MGGSGHAGGEGAGGQQDGARRAAPFHTDGNRQPYTPPARTNLASTYWNQGRWEEAVTLEEKVLEASKTVLGERHPDTLTAMANLASTYRNQGRWEEAVTLEEKVLEASKTVLGERHPSTLTAIGSHTHRRQGPTWHRRTGTRVDGRKRSRWRRRCWRPARRCSESGTLTH